MSDIRFEYDESFGPAYNYELGYLDALKNAFSVALHMQSEGMCAYLKECIEEQKKSVFREIPDDIKDIQGWREEE